MREAVLGLLERGYAVQVVKDVVWPNDKARGDDALPEMEEHGARRTSTEALLTELAGVGAAREGGRP